MFNRRQFLTRTLQGSSLVALGAVVPQFVARTAQAAAPGKDTILVVVEMTGGNDGLNTVIPYADDLYHKARPTLRQTKDVVIRLDDHVGLHSGMQGLRPLWEQGSWRSCRASATRTPTARTSRRWTSGSRPIPKRTPKTGWLGRAAVEIENRSGGVPILHVGPGRLPLALAGAPAAARSASTTRTRSASSWAAARSTSSRPAAGCWRTWRLGRARRERGRPGRRSCSGGRCRR